MTVIPPRRSEQGMYKIMLNQDADDLKVPLSVGGREFSFPLRKLTDEELNGRLNANPQSEGKLYTLYNCTTGALFHIPNNVFTTAAAALGRVTRPCEHQRHKGTQFFNGNRFFCMVANGVVPDKLTIKDPAHPENEYYVSIGYKGKEVYCALCQISHVGGCPEKKKFL